MLVCFKRQVTNDEKKFTRVVTNGAIVWTARWCGNCQHFANVITIEFAKYARRCFDWGRVRGIDSVARKTRGSKTASAIGSSRRSLTFRIANPRRNRIERGARRTTSDFG